MKGVTLSKTMFPSQDQPSSSDWLMLNIKDQHLDTIWDNSKGHFSFKEFHKVGWDLHFNCITVPPLSPLSSRTSFTTKGIVSMNTP